jgi:MerR family transcriptional regulator, copper efflux regulator
MRIQQAAQRLGVSTRTLRHYEASGLLRADRLGNGYRDLSDANLRRAEWVRDLIAAGFSTRELRALVAALDAEPASAVCTGVLRDKLDQIERLIDILERRRVAISERLRAQSAAKKGNALSWKS